MIQEVTVIDALRAHAVIERIIDSEKLIHIATAFKLARLSNDLTLLGETTQSLLAGAGVKVEDSVDFADKVLGDIVEIDTYGLTVADLEKEELLEISIPDASAIVKLLG